MEDWDEAFLAVEYETQRERLNEPNDPNLAGTPSKKSGRRILFGVILGIVGLMILALFVF